jgi:hypothetical protein
VCAWPVKHGMWGHPLYRTWEGMISRCERESDPFYHCYGGRGIQVCARWHDPRLFVEDIECEIGPRPDGMTLDRRDNDGNYEPGKVRWATPVQQAANRRALPPEVRQEVARCAGHARAQMVREAVCAFCGSQFSTAGVEGPREFCSKAHKAAYRRAHHLDDVEKTCHQCGRAFTSNRYDKTRHCGQSCAAICQHAGGCTVVEEVMLG